MTPAGKLQDHLKKLVQGSGGQYRKVRWEGRRGCPDCFIWWRWPRLALVEIKAREGRYADKFSVLQSREVLRMRDAGLPVFTATTLDDIEQIVELVKSGVATSD